VIDSVRVRVTGPRRILSHLEPSRLPVTLDLSDAQVGLSSYQLNEKMIHLPPGLTATVLPPDTIQFKFELIVTKGVEVKPRIKGSLEPGYAMESLEVTPNRIEIVGAQSELQGISQVQTEAIDLTARRESFEKKVKVAVERPHARPAPGQEEVKVRVAIAEKSVQRLLKQVSLKVENARETVRLEPPRVDIVLEGPAGKIDALATDQIVASVVLPEQGPAPESLPVTIWLPVDGIRAIASPEQVGVKVLGPKDSR
jgi:YbbR domain-containing protein